jgi:ADP-glucose pyrophosphorylase
MVDAHIDSRADITIAAQPVSVDDAPAMGIFRFDRTGQIVAF